MECLKPDEYNVNAHIREITLAIGQKDAWVAFDISLRKSFHHSIDLLCFPGKTNMHQKPTQSNVQRIASKREFSYVEL
jgi:hypothetical protein